jgi:hypothetical protein
MELIAAERLIFAQLVPDPEVAGLFLHPHFPKSRLEEAKATGTFIPQGDLYFDGVPCVDCGGLVESYLMHDRAWDALKFKPGDFACLECVGIRCGLERPIYIDDLIPALCRRQGRDKRPTLVLSKPVLTTPDVRYLIGSSHRSGCGEMKVFTHL